MNTCPPEILDYIFSYACTDDGTTGRSLSLVSKWVNRASFPQKYKSIALIGAARMSRFAAFLQSHRVLVRYLMLDCGYPPVDTGSIKRGIRSWDESIERGVASSAWLAHINGWAHTILTFLSPTLVALFLFARRTEIRLKPFIFPRLHTLYLLDFPNQHAIPWNDIAFPRLRRLHSMCQNLRGYTPRSQSTQIKVSALSYFSCCIHHRHEKSLLLDRLKERNNSHATAVKRMKLVILHWGMESENDRTRNPPTPVVSLKGVLENLRENYPNVRLILHADVQKVNEDWWDIVSGGDGCFGDFIR